MNRAAYRCMTLSCFIKNRFLRASFFFHSFSSMPLLIYSVMLRCLRLGFYESLTYFCCPLCLRLPPISAHFTAAVGCPAVFYFLYMCSVVELCYDEHCFSVARPVILKDCISSACVSVSAVL